MHIFCVIFSVEDMTTPYIFLLDKLGTTFSATKLSKPICSITFLYNEIFRYTLFKKKNEKVVMFRWKNEKSRGNLNKLSAKRSTSNSFLRKKIGLNLRITFFFFKMQQSVHLGSLIFVPFILIIKSCLLFINLSIKTLLQVNNPKHKRLSRWWATRHVNVNRNNSITPSDNRVGIMIIATAIRATTHWKYPLRVHYLLIQPAKSRCHFISESAGHDN